MNNNIDQIIDDIGRIELEATMMAAQYQNLIDSTTAYHPIHGICHLFTKEGILNQVKRIPAPQGLIYVPFRDTDDGVKLTTMFIKNPYYVIDN